MAKLGAHVMYSALLTEADVNALPCVGKSEPQTFAELDVQRQEIMEQMALGRMPNEVALCYGVPVLAFRAWMAGSFSKAQLDNIRAAAAESLQVKSILVLSAELKNPAEASQAKALADRMARMSEALDPKAWNPAHSSPDRAPQSVTVTFSSARGVDTQATVMVSMQQPVTSSGDLPYLSQGVGPTIERSAVGPILTIDMFAPQPSVPRTAGWE